MHVELAGRAQHGGDDRSAPALAGVDRRLAPSTSWVARSARATADEGHRDIVADDLEVSPAELVEQPSLGVEAWAGPPCQTVAGRHEHAEQLTGGSPGHARRPAGSRDRRRARR